MEKLLDPNEFYYMMSKFLFADHNKNKIGEDIMEDVLTKHEIPKHLIWFLRFSGYWYNDVMGFVLDFYGIKTETCSIDYWKLKGKTYEAFSNEYRIALKKLIEEKYQERKRRMVND